MLKTSFSPHYPNQPTLLNFYQTINSTSQTPTKSLLRKDSIYLAKFATENKEIFMTVPTKEIEVMISALTKLIEKQSIRAKDDVLVELVADFLESSSGKTYIIQCKGHKYDYYSRATSSLLSVFINRKAEKSRTTSPIPSIEHNLPKMSEHKIMIENVAKRLEKLGIKTKKVHRTKMVHLIEGADSDAYIRLKAASVSGSVPFLQLGESKSPTNCVSYQSPTPSKHTNRSENSIKFSEQLDKVAEMYDTHRQQARITREGRKKQRKLTLPEKKNLDSLIAHIFESLSQDGELGFSIRSDEIQSINMLRVIFSYSLNGYSRLLRNLIEQFKHGSRFNSHQIHRLFEFIKKTVKELFNDEDFELFDERVTKFEEKLSE